MDDALRLLTVQFLAWAERSPRTYGEAMAAWRTSCPRLPVWEDALDGGLVRVEPAPVGAMADSAVVLTQRGRAVLAAIEQAATTPGGNAPAYGASAVAGSGCQPSASIWVSRS